MIRPSAAFAFGVRRFAQKQSVLVRTSWRADIDDRFGECVDKHSSVAVVAWLKRYAEKCIANSDALCASAVELFLETRVITPINQL